MGTTEAYLADMHSCAYSVANAASHARTFVSDCKKIAKIVQLVDGLAYETEPQILAQSSRTMTAIKDLKGIFRNILTLLAECEAVQLLRPLVCAGDINSKLTFLLQELAKSLKVLNRFVQSRQQTSIVALADDFLRTGFQALKAGELRFNEIKRLVLLKPGSSLEQLERLRAQCPEYGGLSKEEKHMELRSLRAELQFLLRVGNKPQHKTVLQLMLLVWQDVTDHNMPPLNMVCPLSFRLLREPVILVESNYTYDKSAISYWLNNVSASDPCCGRVLRSLNIIPNMMLQGLVEQWLAKHPGYRDDWQDGLPPAPTSSGMSDRSSGSHSDAGVGDMSGAQPLGPQHLRAVSEPYLGDRDALSLQLDRLSTSTTYNPPPPGYPSGGRVPTGSSRSMIVAPESSARAIAARQGPASAAPGLNMSRSPSECGSCLSSERAGAGERAGTCTIWPSEVGVSPSVNAYLQQQAHAQAQLLPAAPLQAPQAWQGRAEEEGGGSGGSDPLHGSASSSARPSSSGTVPWFEAVAGQVPNQSTSTTPRMSPAPSPPPQACDWEALTWLSSSDPAVRSAGLTEVLHYATEEALSEGLSRSRVLQAALRVPECMGGADLEMRGRVLAVMQSLQSLEDVEVTEALAAGGAVARVVRVLEKCRPDSALLGPATSLLASLTPTVGREAHDADVAEDAALALTKLLHLALTSPGASASGILRCALGFAGNATTREAVVGSGMLPLLLQALQGGKERDRLLATQVLGQLSEDRATAPAVVACGAPQVLQQTVLSGGSVQLTQAAGRALNALSASVTPQDQSRPGMMGSGQPSGYETQGWPQAGLGASDSPVYHQPVAVSTRTTRTSMDLPSSRTSRSSMDFMSSSAMPLPRSSCTSMDGEAMRAVRGDVLATPFGGGQHTGTMVPSTMSAPGWQPSSGDGTERQQALRMESRTSNSSSGFSGGLGPGEISLQPGGLPNMSGIAAASSADLHSNHSSAWNTDTRSEAECHEEAVDVRSERSGHSSQGHQSGSRSNLSQRSGDTAQKSNRTVSSTVKGWLKSSAYMFKYDDSKA